MIVRIGDAREENDTLVEVRSGHDFKGCDYDQKGNVLCLEITCDDRFVGTALSKHEALVLAEALRLAATR